MTKPNFKPLILAVLAATVIAVGLALEPRMVRVEGGTDMDDAIALEVDEPQEFTSSGEQVYVWFTFTTGGVRGVLLGLSKQRRGCSLPPKTLSFRRQRQRPWSFVRARPH